MKKVAIIAATALFALAQCCINPKPTGLGINKSIEVNSDCLPCDVSTKKVLIEPMIGEKLPCVGDRTCYTVPHRQKKKVLKTTSCKKVSCNTKALLCTPSKCSIKEAGPAKDENSCDKRVMTTYKEVIGPDGIKIMQKHKYYESSIDDVAQEIAYQIYNQYIRICKDDQEPIIMTSFVNLHDFNETSNFGRLLSETVMSYLQKYHLPLYEYRIKNRLVVNKRGEFFLTREAKDIKKGFVDGFVFVGTYAINKKHLQINARLVNYQSGAIVATATLDIRDKKFIKELCKNGLCNFISQPVLTISGN